ncbi:hypothetical protein NEIPOLOT_01020 [Neisseria polysaccharea ATCC 43768]|nr:hypothetical protein NEIPOLOT_01020 [Neisseria polysaccharea ATCC 43768]
MFSVSFALRRDVGGCGVLRLTLSVCRYFCGLKPVLSSCFFR